MTTVTLHPGDNIASMRRMAANSVDSIVTDPPYLLTSIAQRFGKKGAAAARTEGNDGSFARLSGGFMGRMWDSPNVEMPKIDADFANYMAGFIDGEGCFSVHKKNVNGYETFDCQFSITLREDDKDILLEMQRRMNGIGSFAIRNTVPGNPQARYCISSKRDCMTLRTILDFFPLRAKKRRDFEIWAHALDAWIEHEPGSDWEDMSFYRDQLMLVKKFGSFYKPELLFHYRWCKEVFRVLKPGGYCFAFSGSRTGHWQACAMEMAGFIMHPMHGWCFGSGFPKAHDARRAIDNHVAFDGSGDGEAWDGWAYGTQSQKPALEPIYLAQKPFSEKTGAANLLKHGVGAVNIDGCRVPTSDNLNGGAENGNRGESPSLRAGSGMNVPGKTVGTAFVQPEVRHPANLILDGSPEVVAMFPNGKSGVPGTRRKEHETDAMSGTLGMLDRVEVGYADEGSAARFFHQFSPDTDPLFYHPKAGKLDRAGSRHPTVKPIALMQYLIRHITPPGGVVLDPFAGSGTTAEAARREGFDCILMEAESEYIEFLESRFSISGGQEPNRTVETYLNLLGFNLP